MLANVLPPGLQDEWEVLLLRHRLQFAIPVTFPLNPLTTARLDHIASRILSVHRGVQEALPGEAVGDLDLA